MGLSLGAFAFVIAIGICFRSRRTSNIERDKEYRKPELDAKDVSKPTIEKDSTILYEMEAENVRRVEHEMDTARSLVETEGSGLLLIGIAESRDDAGKDTSNAAPADMKGDIFVRYA